MHTPSGFRLFGDALCVLRNRIKECRDIAHFIRTDFMIYGISARYERGVDLRNDFSTAFSHDGRHHGVEVAVRNEDRRAASCRGSFGEEPAGKRQVEQLSCGCVFQSGIQSGPKPKTLQLQ